MTQYREAFTSARKAFVSEISQHIPLSAHRQSLRAHAKGMWAHFWVATKQYIPHHTVLQRRIQTSRYYRYAQIDQFRDTESEFTAYITFKASNALTRSKLTRSRATRARAIAAFFRTLVPEHFFITCTSGSTIGRKVTKSCDSSAKLPMLRQRFPIGCSHWW